jgi:histidine triad (HIT) family protein
MAEYESTTKDGKCVFCEIVGGGMKTPGIFWQDEEFMAFLTLFPNMAGVTAVIPKKHYGSDVLGMPNDILQRMILAAKKVSQILLKHYEDVGRVGLIMEGTGIDHAHIKLYPMHGTGEMKKGGWRQCPSKIDKYFEKYEGYLCSNDGPRADERQLGELAEKLRK